VLLSAILQSSPHVLVSLKSSGIKSIEDFKNRKIMVSSGESKNTSFTSMLKLADVSPDDMISVPHTFDLKDLLNKKTDIVSLFRSNELYTLDKMGVEYNVWDPKEYGLDFYDVVLFTSNANLNKSPKAVEDFRDASLKGWKYAFEHIDETINVILQKYNTQNKTKEALIYEAKVLKELVYADEKRLGDIDKNKIQRIYDIYNLMGLVKNIVDLDELIFISSDENTLLNRFEKKYLKNKKEITVCIDPNWMPFESFKDGEHIGISADYFKIFQESLGVPLTVIKSQTWSESLELAQGRKCDVMSLAMQTPERKKYLNFTVPYLKIPLVIATKLDVPFINDITTIGDEKIGIPKGYAFVEILRKKYPQLNIVEVENIKDGLEKVNNGELFAYIGTLASIGRMFQMEFTGELKIAGKFDEGWELGVGVRNDDEVLLGIFNKIIKNVDTAKRQQILNNWVAIKYEKGVDNTLTWQIVVAILFVILLVVYRNSILKRSNIYLQMAKDRADKKTVEAQQEKESLQYMLGTTMEGIAIFEDGICIDINDAALRMYGYKNKKELLGQRALVLIAPSSIELVRENIQAGYDKPYEMTSIRADKTEFPTLVNARSYMSNGKKRRISSVLDLTQFKESEKELIKAKEMAENATKVKADFLSNMSHEIRTPMNGIVGMLHLLEKTSLDNKQVEYIFKIKRASNNLLSMVNDLLDFSKIEAGKLEVHSVDFDMNAVLQNVKDLVELKALEKGLDLGIPILEANSIFYGDSLRLSQVLINLTNNAIKFTHEGKVTITLEFKQENILHFSVKDTGIGISKENQEELFQSFEQADASITREYGGSGLGLSISKELIELMNGKIWLESEIGKGSEFIFEIKFPKGDAKNIDSIGLNIEGKTQEDKTDKEDITTQKRDKLFRELKKAVETSRPKSYNPIIQEMQKYNFSDKDDKIFKNILLLIKKYKFKEVLAILDGK